MLWLNLNYSSMRHSAPDLRSSGKKRQSKSHRGSVSSTHNLFRGLLYHCNCSGPSNTLQHSGPRWYVKVQQISIRIFCTVACGVFLGNVLILCQFCQIQKPSYYLILCFSWSILLIEIFLNDYYPYLLPCGVTVLPFASPIFSSFQ